LGVGEFRGDVSAIVWLREPVSLTDGLPPAMLARLERDLDGRPARARVLGYDRAVTLPAWLAGQIAEPAP
jgi:hypothetical protein